MSALSTNSAHTILPRLNSQNVGQPGATQSHSDPPGRQTDLRFVITELIWSESAMAGPQLHLRRNCVIGLAALSVFFHARAGASSASSTPRRQMGVSAVSEAHNGSLLIEYFKAFLSDRDIEAFRGHVSARYNEGTLGRILSGSSDVAARRAAVLSLGIVGSFEHSNTVLGKALGDDDPVVRSMAEDALWAVWFRADTPEHNQMLSQVQLAISRDQLEQAEVLVTRLIAQAPNFAEAFNQRAIIFFLQGRFAESMQDCQQVLSRNPYHFGAISGMAQSQVRLNRPQDALKSLRRALKIQPHHATLRESIRILEAGIESDGPR
jgi:tetratricopeptide (TPR) repeat protein